MDNNASKPEESQRPPIKEIFLAAQEMTSGVRREQYLAEVAGDDQDLRQRIDRMLATHEGAASNPLNRAVEDLDLVASDATSCSTIDIYEHSNIGPYKLLEQIGEGGMGTVFMAQQTAPIKRKVALKIIKPGMDTQQVVARFGAERQALALMDHQNIAKVLDAGATDSGRPYFVMELVKGVTLTDYCQREKLTTEQRLELIIDVGRGVQHAHQKGIIHRDLKPGNILITLHDGVPVVKIIDFGIAKAVNQELTEQTLFTQYSQMVGTPLYMSPEQAELSGLDVDTRSDVYSLGVVLYELLTGTTPFDRESLRELGLDEVRKMIRETEPPRPSQRVSTLQATDVSTLSRKKTSDARRLQIALRGELDWIVMKALEKDRNRRYESASAFSQDIQRYLDDEPVQACPPTVNYRLKKFAKRNKAVLTMAAIVFVSLLAGTGIATWQTFVAIGERKRAQQSEYNAEQKSAIAEAVTDFLQVDLLGKSSPGQTPNPEVKLHTILDRAATRIDKKFENQPLVEAAIRDTIGQAYQALGKYKKAEPHQTRAVELAKQQLGDEDPLTLVYSTRLGRLMTDLGRYKDSEKLLRQTLASQQRILGENHLDAVKSMLRLGDALRRLARYDEAENMTRQSLNVYRRILGEEHEETLKSMGNLAVIYLERGRYDEAENLNLQSLDIRKRTLGEEHPDTLMGKANLVAIYLAQGRYNEAEQLLLKSLETEKRILGAEHPHTLVSMENLAVIYGAQGRYNDAEKLHQKTLETSRRALGVEHPHTLNCMGNLANIYLDQGRYDEAEKLQSQTYGIRLRTLGGEHPNTLASMNNLAATYRRQRRFNEAEKLIQQTLEIERRTLGKEHPDTLHSADHLASIYAEQGRCDEAEKLNLQTLEVEKRTLGEEHPLTQNCMSNLAISYRFQGRYEEAEKLNLHVLNVRTRTLGEEHPHTLISMNNLANDYYDQSRFDEAEQLRLRTLELRKRTLGVDHSDTLSSMNDLAIHYLQRKRYVEAEKLIKLTLEIRKRTLGVDHPDTLNSMNDLGVTYRRQGRYPEAEKYFEQTLEGRKRILGEENSNTLVSMHNLAFLYKLQNRNEEAEKLEVRMLEIRKRTLGEQHPETLKSIASLESLYTNWSWKLSTEVDLEKRDPAKALELAQNAVELNPNKPKPWRVLGWAHYRLGQWQETIDAEMKSIELQKNAGDPWQWLFLAMAHWQMGNKESANQYYSSSVVSHGNSTNEEVIRFFAEAEELMELSVDDREQFALDYLTNLLNKDPDDIDLLIKRAKLYGQQKRWAEQAADLEIVVQTRPDDSTAVYKLTWAYLQLKNGDSALKQGQNLVRLRPDVFSSHVRLGRAHQLLKNDKAAIACFDRAVELRPDYPWIYQLRSASFIGLSRWEEALADAQRFNQLKEFDANGWNREALLLLRLGDNAGYQEHCQRWLDQSQEDPSGPFRRGSVQASSLGRLPKEDLDQMMTIANEFLQEDPNHAGLHRNLGVFYYRQEKYPQATARFEQALELNEIDVRNLAWLAMAKFKTGNTLEAQAGLQRAREQREINSATWSASMSQLEIPLLFEEAEALIENR